MNIKSKLAWLLFISTSSACIAGMLPSSFSEKINETEGKEIETEGLDMAINEAKLYEGVSSLAIKGKMSQCIFQIKQQQQQIKKRF